MIIGRTARIDLTVLVVDRDGRTVFRDGVTDSQSDMKFMETGVFANIADLQTLLQTVLDRSVDRVLDSSAFRAAVSRAEICSLLNRAHADLGEVQRGGGGGIAQAVRQTLKWLSRGVLS